MALEKVITPLSFDATFDPGRKITVNVFINTKVEIKEGEEVLYSFTKRYPFILGQPMQDQLNSFVQQLLATIR